MAVNTPQEARLLAIDDSVLIHRLLRARLKYERLEVHSATSGQEGLSMARALKPDAILLDIDMPDLTGFAVLTQLKLDPVTREIPVIFLSGSSTAEERVKALELGAIDFVSKPFDVTELRARVRVAVRIHRLIRMLGQRAQIDGLTGLWNRRYFDERLEQEISEARRHSTPLALLMCDLDHFKVVNDTFGHPVGDQVLEELANLLTEGRTSDIACRYGGEEFAVILPQCDLQEATIAAQRLREAVNAREWNLAPSLSITVSVGVADLTCSADASPLGLVQAADEAMYRAKRAGRNRVEVAPSNMRPRLSA